MSGCGPVVVVAQDSPTGCLGSAGGWGGGQPSARASLCPCRLPPHPSPLQGWHQHPTLFSLCPHPHHRAAQPRAGLSPWGEQDLDGSHRAGPEQLGPQTQPHRLLVELFVSSPCHCWCCAPVCSGLQGLGKGTDLPFPGLGRCLPHVSVGSALVQPPAPLTCSPPWPTGTAWRRRDGAQRSGSAAGAGPPQPGEQGWSRANPRAGQSWERSRSSLPPRPCRAPSQPPAPRAAPGQCPLLTLAMSLLCKQLNKLFGDRQAQVWVQWSWGQRWGAGLLLALSLCRHLPHGSHRTPNTPKKKRLKGAERFLLYSRIVYIPYTYMPIHTHTSPQQACATGALKQSGVGLTVKHCPYPWGTLVPALSQGAPWPGSPSARRGGGRWVCWGPYPPPGWGRQPHAQDDAAGCV